MFVGNITEIDQRGANAIENALARQSVRGLRCTKDGKPFKKKKEKKKVDRLS